MEFPRKEQPYKMKDGHQPTDWSALLTPVRADPWQWYVIAEAGRSTATQTRARLAAAHGPDWSFTCRSTSADRTRYRLYARYKGGQRR